MRYQNHEKKTPSFKHIPSNVIIGGEVWKRTIAAYEKQQGRPITKGERLEFELLLCGKAAKYKTKGKATDLRMKGGDYSSAVRSESLRGGIAADNDKGLISLRKKLPKLPKPVSAK